MFHRTNAVPDLTVLSFSKFLKFLFVEGISLHILSIARESYILASFLNHGTDVFALITMLSLLLLLAVSLSLKDQAGKSHKQTLRIAPVDGGLDLADSVSLDLLVVAATGTADNDWVTFILEDKLMGLVQSNNPWRPWPGALRSLARSNQGTSAAASVGRLVPIVGPRSHGILDRAEIGLGLVDVLEEVTGGILCED